MGHYLLIGHPDIPKLSELKFCYSLLEHINKNTKFHKIKKLVIPVPIYRAKAKKRVPVCKINNKLYFFLFVSWTFSIKMSKTINSDQSSPFQINGEKAREPYLREIIVFRFFKIFARNYKSKQKCMKIINKVWGRILDVFYCQLCAL